MRDIIIFGLGIIGRNAILFFEKKYKIVLLVDNDKSKWGNSFGNYMIESPDKIQQFDCDVVVTPQKYGMEIVNQLQDMGVSRDRIFLCRRYWTGGGSKCDIYPLVIQKAIETEKRLHEYDLLNTVESEGTNMKIMVFAIFYSTYAKQLIENISRRYEDIEFSIITNQEDYKENIVSEKLKHIYYFQTMADLKTILDELPVYDAMQLLWIEREWSYFYEQIRKKTKRLNLNVGGSDFYRSLRAERDYKRKLIVCADRVTAETAGTVHDFESYYSSDVAGKMDLLPFGIEVLDFIKSGRDRDKCNMKKKYHIPLNKVVVTCGHNAIEEHQHMKIIAALECLPDHIKEQIVCVFPMTYPNGSEEYIDRVGARLSESGLVHVILTEFMDFQAMAEYALISDIMIHVQTTDQLSSTMLEEIYAGSVAIAGSWLPYQSLHEMGIYFLDVDTIPDVTAVLEDVVTNLELYQERCAENSELVWRHSSWDILAPKWRALWD